MAEETEILRQFTDDCLLANPLGQALVDIYYGVGPPMAEFVADHPSLKPIAGSGLAPPAAVSVVAVSTSATEKAAISVLLVLVSVAVAARTARRRGRTPQHT